MKYIAYWELDKDNMDGAIHKVNQIFTQMEASPDRFAKILFPHQLMEVGYRGFTILESTDTQELAALMLMASPEVKVTFTPLYDASEALRSYNDVKEMISTMPEQESTEYNII